jgi:F-type H+-transporting ATPase subunit epsilon
MVVTPERACLDETADFVALPMYDGELGVLPGRAALIGRLGYGELRLRLRDVVQRYYIDGGFAQVRDDVVTVLTPRALKAEEINPEAARQALEAAQAPEAQQRARAQLRVATRID